MYGLKRDIDLSFLQGTEIIYIGIGMYQVIFSFDEDVTVTVESCFRHTSKTGVSEWRPEMPHTAAPALDLLASKVEGVRSSENGTVDLTFSNGSRLQILDENVGYESYQISRRGETIVV